MITAIARFGFMFALIQGFTVEKATATEFYDYAQKKQVAKDAKRWSLSEWLEQKKRNKLMDMWLMYNAPSPYEFFFGVDTSSFEQKEKQGTAESLNTFRNYRGSLGAFVTIVGLYAEYETSDEELEQWKALLMLRLLGSSDQSTNITGHYGLINRTITTNGTEEQWQHQVGGGRLTLYIFQPFALTGLYEYIIEAESTGPNPTAASGYRVEGGAHLEYGALRLYGLWYQEVMDLDNGTSQIERTREGIQFGTRVYF